MTDQERISALEKANAELRERLNALEQPKPKPEPFKPPPYQPVDWTAGASMGRATMAEFAAAASAGGIANDAWRSTQPSSIIPKTVVKEEPKGVPSEGGWQKERPLEMPPGVKIIDDMMAVDDEIWRRERALQFGHGLKKDGE